MPRTLNTHGQYPADWKAVSDAACAAAGHRCIRCQHPYRKGEWTTGEWSDCDALCRHDTGSIRIHNGVRQAQWRILTTHHFDGNKANCVWWNLLALCQRCHLQIQTRVNPNQPYMFEHSDWLKPYVAGFYSKKYEGRDITREQAIIEMDRLLALERIA